MVDMSLTAVPTLTVPCTLGQLRAWLKAADAMRPGDEVVSVTATSTTINVA